jgi:RNA polymerase sigma-70 factor (ECF subfamily)
LEAAIESAWMSRVVSGRPSGSELLALYDGLLQVAPSYGAHLGRILVLAEAHSPANALSELDALPEAKRYAPYWVLRAHLLRQIGAQRDAEAALARAQSFTADPAVRDFLAGEPSLT